MVGEQSFLSNWGNVTMISRAVNVGVQSLVN